MRKTVVAITALLVVAGSFAAPALAAKKSTTLYLHGKGPVQEAYLNEMWTEDIWMTMDSKKPTDSEFSSMFVTNYFRGPNTDCDGNGLLPLWKGDFSGSFKGDVKITLHTVATPAVTMTASLYKDPTGTCTGNLPTGATEAPPPVAQTEVDVAPGHATTEITLKNVRFKAMSSVLVQLHIPNLTTPGQVRILFDSAEFDSNVQFIGR